MSTKTYLFTEKQLHDFLHTTIIGTFDDINSLSTNFLKELDIDSAYEEVIKNPYDGDPGSRKTPPSNNLRGGNDDG